MRRPSDAVLGTTLQSSGNGLSSLHAFPSTLSWKREGEREHVEYELCFLSERGPLG